MMTLLALPAMLARRYDPALATGAIAASATLGILIPPSIMLVLMANLLAISVGALFMGAIVPGLILSVLYVLYIVVVCALHPDKAPPVQGDDIDLAPSNPHYLRLFFGGCGLAVLLSLGETVGFVCGCQLALAGTFGVFYGVHCDWQA